MNSGWNNKNTLDFGFDKNGNHVIFNMDGEIVDVDLEDSPFCELCYDLFKKEYPTKEIYKQKMKEFNENLSKITSDEIKDIITKAFQKYISVIK